MRDKFQPWGPFLKKQIVHLLAEMYDYVIASMFKGNFYYADNDIPTLGSSPRLWQFYILVWNN